jgi:DNA-binding transcriptional ArsR family regulator
MVNPVSSFKNSSSKPRTEEARSGAPLDSVDINDLDPSGRDLVDQDPEPVRLPSMGSLMAGLRGFRSAKQAPDPALAGKKEEPITAASTLPAGQGSVGPVSIEPVHRREAVQARERLLDFGITFDLPERLQAAEMPSISGEALRVLASCPQGELSTETISDMLRMEHERVRQHLAALEGMNLVTIQGENAMITHQGVRVLDYATSQGNSVETTLEMLDLTLAAANRRFADGNGSTLEILQAYTTAMSRDSQASTRVDALEIARINLDELVWMVQGLDASRMPVGFDDLAKRLVITFPDTYQPLVAPTLRRIVEIQGLFNLSGELEKRSGKDLVDFATKTSTYLALHDNRPGLSTLKTASLVALQALHMDALLHSDKKGLGATPNNAGRIACAIIEGAGQGARLWSFEQFQALLDPAVGALAATSKVGREIIGERIRFTRPESKAFLANLSRPVLSQCRGNVDLATSILVQVAEQIRIPLASSEQKALRADLMEIRDLDASMSDFADSVLRSYLEHPDQAREIARSVSVEASAAGVDGALRLYAFLTESHPNSLLDDLSMATLAALTLSSDADLVPFLKEEERQEAQAFAKTAESFLMGIGGISPTSDPKLQETFRSNLKVFVAKESRAKNPERHEIAFLQKQMVPGSQSGITPSTPESTSYRALNVAQFLEKTGIQRPEIRTVLGISGLDAWSESIKTLRGGDLMEGLANLGITAGQVDIPEGGWTRAGLARQIADIEALNEAEGSVWLHNRAKSIYMSWNGSDSDTASGAILAMAKGHRGQIVLASHGVDAGFDDLASQLKEAGLKVHRVEIGDAIADLSAREGRELPTEAELEEAEVALREIPAEVLAAYRRG